MRRAHDELEMRVRERTAELEDTNIELEAEVADRKRAEKALRESEERLRLLSDLTVEGIVIHDKGIILDANEALARMFGYGNVSEIIGKSGADLMTPESQELLQQHIETGSDEPYEAIGIKKDGTHFPIEIDRCNIKYKGKIVRTGVVHDLTERKRAEEAFKESEERFYKAFYSSPIPMTISRVREGLWLDVNNAYCRLVEYSRDELIGHYSTDLNIIDQAERERLVRVTLEKGNLNGAEVTLRTKSGKRYTTLYHIEKVTLQGVEHAIVTAINITERKRAEEALRESEELYRGLFETMQENFSLMEVITDEQGHAVDYRFLDVNPALERYSGKSREQLVGHKHSDFMAAGGGTAEQKWFDIICKVSLTGKEESGEHYAVSTGRWAQFHAFSPRHGQCAVISMDITDRKMAEEALRESENLLHAVMEAAPDPVFLKDTECRMLLANPATLRVVGKPAEQVIGRTDREFYDDPKIGEAINENDRRVMLSGKTEVVEERAPSPEGYRTYLSTKSPWFDADGRIVGLVGVARDITERKRAEEELRKAHDELELKVQERTAELEEKNVKLENEINERKLVEEKIREQATLLDKAQDAIAVQDLEHRIIYWNKGAQRLYGWMAEEIVGRNADELLYREESSQLTEARKKVIKEGEWMGELRQRIKEGGDIIVESRWTLVRDDEGKPKSILIINTDITEKKKIESQLMRAQRMESIGTLAGGIAHDLNNMLTPMMMSLHVLKEKFKDEHSQKLLNILEKNSQRSADLIKQVLSFSRGVEGERNPLQAKHIINEIEKVIKETFPRNIEIRTDIPKDLFTISGDATQLHQVIMNLCVNARDAMPDGGILNISAENFFIDENFAQMNTEAKVGSYVVIAVSDTGIGIPPKILDRIFEPFFTTKGFGKGTGLGLSTALAIAKSHGGFINVYSEVGKGTKFRVYLPSTLAEIQNVEEDQLEWLRGHRELVLIAEDEDSVREVTISTLENNGYNVLAANDGADAVALYAQNKDNIKVVLMDMMMPVMDGETSIRAIRKINPEVKVIVVSGLAEKDKIAKIESTRAQAILPKPYTAERLLKAMHEVLREK